MPSRWITARKPFDFRWPSGAITVFREADLGEHLVKDELADFAVEQGYATEGKVDAAARSTKGTKRTGKATKAAKAPNSGSDDAVAQPSVADADRAADGQPVDADAE